MEIIIIKIKINFILDLFHYIPEKEKVNDKKNEIEENFINNIKEEEENIEEIIQLVKPKEEEIALLIQKKEKIIGKKSKKMDNMNNEKGNYFQLDPEIFNEYDSQLINKIIENIKEGENEDYEICTDPPYKPKHLLEKEFHNGEYIIKDLIDYSRNYMLKCFEYLSKSNTDFSNIAICFILDYSKYLGIHYKYNH